MDSYKVVTASSPKGLEDKINQHAKAGYDCKTNMSYCDRLNQWSIVMELDELVAAALIKAAKELEDEEVSSTGNLDGTSAPQSHKKKK